MAWRSGPGSLEDIPVVEQPAATNAVARAMAWQKERVVMKNLLNVGGMPACPGGSDCD
jgi:hypothetical protein